MFVATNHHSLFTFNEAVSIAIIYYVRQYRPFADTCRRSRAHSSVYIVFSIEHQQTVSTGQQLFCMASS